MGRMLVISLKTAFKSDNRKPNPRVKSKIGIITRGRNRVFWSGFTPYTINNVATKSN